jgi:hypothetical protein
MEDFDFDDFLKHVAPVVAPHLTTEEAKREAALIFQEMQEHYGSNQAAVLIEMQPDGKNVIAYAPEAWKKKCGVPEECDPVGREIGDLMDPCKPRAIKNRIPLVSYGDAMDCNPGSQNPEAYAAMRALERKPRED